MMMVHHAPFASSQHLPIMRLACSTVLVGAILLVCFIQYEVILSTLNREVLGRQKTQIHSNYKPMSTNSVATSLSSQPIASRHEAIPSPSVAQKAFTMDVLSSGSTTRWDYILAQQRTWGSHPSIRYFEGVNEAHHDLYNASCLGIKQKVLQCRNLGNKTTSDGHRTRYFAPEIKPERVFTKKSEGWMCAQHRPVIGLHGLYGPRYRHGKNIPDWLLLVDDDTVVHMNVMELAISNLNASVAHVLVGKHIFYGWPHGGFGVALSRAAILRLFLPNYCNNNNNTNDSRRLTKDHDFETFSKQFCQISLQKNLISELEEFVDGMSVIDLMLAIQLHRQPFCWHSDWYMGWFLTNHVMLGQPLPKFPECPAPYNCRPNATTCEATMLTCHHKKKSKRLEHLMANETY
jgi:hypothetical protein